MGQHWGVLIGVAALAFGIAGCKSKAQSELESAASGYEAAKARALAAGLKLKWVDTIDPASIPKEDNALPDYQLASQKLDAIKDIKQIEKDALELAAQTGNGPRVRLAQMFKQVEEPLQIFVKGSSKPRMGDYERYSVEPPTALDFPQLAGVKRFVKLLSARGIYRAGIGDREGAISDFRACFNWAKSTGYDPIIINALVEIALDAITVRAIENAIALRPNDRQFFAMAKKLVSSKASNTDITKYLFGEAAYQIEFMNDPANFKAGALEKFMTPPDAEEEVSSPFPKGLDETLVSRANTRRVLDLWSEFAERSKGEKDPIKLSNLLLSITKPIESKTELSYRAVTIILPVFSQFGNAFVKRDAQDRCVLGVIAVADFKARTGRFPSTLKEADYRAIDPYDGKPLRYRVEGGQAYVYSVGPDKVDDKGLRRTAGAGGPTTFDVASIFPRDRTKN